MNLAKIAAVASLFAVSQLAGAAPLSYQFNGPAFTYGEGVFQNGGKITGEISFDDTALDASGNGSIASWSGNINPDFSWSFKDGYNDFNNVNTLYSFTMQVSFTNFMPSSWNIDATHGWTHNDIFVNSGGNNYSIYQGQHAFGPNASAANWTRVQAADVPEPGSIALMGLGMAGLAALRRRKSAK